MERSLSQNEAKVILDLEWRGQKTVTLAELRQALGGSESYTRYLGVTTSCINRSVSPGKRTKATVDIK